MRASDIEVVGVGLGPSNLALCVALEEARSKATRLFVERAESFEWHPGMQLEGSGMQTPFMEDLVTRHDPTSSFTFLNYLKEHGRLTDFADLRDFYPSRVEFNDYFRWAAEKLRAWIRYGTEVVAIRPVVTPSHDVEVLSVALRDVRTGEEHAIRAHNIVLGLGYSPVFPGDGGAQAHSRVFHSTSFMPKVRDRFPLSDAPYSFLVGGAGQSAAEIVLCLLKRYPNAAVTVVARGFVFRSKDPSPFVSAFYTGSASDEFFELDAQSRDLLLTALDDSNYSAADAGLLQELAKFVYVDKVEGRNRLRLKSFYDVREFHESETKVSVTCWSSLHKRENLFEVDGVFLATGYDDALLERALADVRDFLKRTDAGGYCINRQYRLETDASFRAGVYVQGYARKSHGCTEGTISDLPHRAQRIVQSLAQRRYERRRSQAVAPAGP